MTILCNVGSLVLGLLAWAIPFAAAGKRLRFESCCISSLGCCILSLILQLLEVRHRVHLGDWSALMDTSDAVVLAALVLIAGALIANVIAGCCAQMKGRTGNV